MYGRFYVEYAVLYTVPMRSDIRECLMIKNANVCVLERFPE